MARRKVICFAVLLLCVKICAADLFDIDDNNIPLAEPGKNEFSGDYKDKLVDIAESIIGEYNATTNATTEYPTIGNETIPDTNATTEYPTTGNETIPDTNVTTEYPTTGNQTTPDTNATTEYPTTGNQTIPDTNVTTEYPTTGNQTTPDTNATTEYPTTGNQTIPDTNATTEYPTTGNQTTPDTNATTEYPTTGNQTTPDTNATTEYPTTGNQTTPDTNATTEYPTTGNQTTPDTNATTEYPTTGNQTTPDTNATTEYPTTGNQTTPDTNATTEYPTTGNQTTPDTNATTEYPTTGNQTTPETNATTEYPTTGNQTTPDTNATTEYPPTGNQTTPDTNATTEYPPTGNQTTTQNITTTEQTPTTESIDQGVPPNIEGINGTTLLNRLNDTIYAYLRIPYAEAPIGNYRFKDPVKLEGVIGRADPTIDLPFCIQMLDNDTVIGQEDCLYLNVYTPAFNPDDNELKPVMVFLHGDRFEQGSGGLDLYHPKFMLTKNIVLVTVNYRLGIFGFFNLENEKLGTPGNAGLKDQNMALQWVKNNIQSFKGDPENICLFGQGAGAASVHLHILSPLSTGLFTKAIMQSGTAISPWTLGARNNGIELAKKLNISTEGEEAMLQELIKAPGSELLTAARYISREMPIWRSLASPIVERHGNGKSFLPEDPFVTMENDGYNHVPVIIGYTDAEGIAIEQYLRTVRDMPAVIEDFFDLIPSDLEIDRGTSAADQLISRIKEFYYGETGLNNTKTFIKIFTDIFFGFPAFRTALEHSRVSKDSVYFYKFTADTELNIYKLRDNISAEFEGASNRDDLGYIFFAEGLTPKELGELEANALDRVVDLWSSFAADASPRLTKDTETNLWLPFNAEQTNFANIANNDTKIDVELDSTRMQFWNDVYKQFFRSSASSNYVISALFALCITLQIIINF